MVIDTVVSANNGRLPLVLGIGGNNTQEVILEMKSRDLSHFSAILSVSPYYNKATPDGIVMHYLSVCHSVSLPVIVYNVPGRTGLDIPVSAYQRLSRIPNIAGVKEASTDISKIAKIRNACGFDFPVWSGNDDQIVPVMAMGGKGVISVLSNVKPEETKVMCDAALDGDFDTAADLQCKLLPLIDFLFCEVNPIPVKAAMKQIGFDCGSCRLPLCGLNSENSKKMQSVLR